MKIYQIGQFVKTNPNKPNFKNKKMCLDAPKILTITNMDANLKKMYGVSSV